MGHVVDVGVGICNNVVGHLKSVRHPSQIAGARGVSQIQLFAIIKGHRGPQKVIFW